MSQESRFPVVLSAPVGWNLNKSNPSNTSLFEGPVCNVPRDLLVLNPIQNTYKCFSFTEINLFCILSQIISFVIVWIAHTP